MSVVGLIEQIAQLLVSSSLVSVIVIFLGRKIIELFLSKDLEKFKVELKREAIEFQIKYQSLHSERASAIKEIYQRMLATENSLHAFIRPLQESGEVKQIEKGHETAKIINDFISYFDNNKIYLDERTEEKVEKIILICKTSFNDFNFALSVKEEDRREFITEWKKAWDTFNKELPNAKQEVLREFRKLIGVNI